MAKHVRVVVPEDESDKIVDVVGWSIEANIEAAVK